MSSSQKSLTGTSTDSQNTTPDNKMSVDTNITDLAQVINQNQKISILGLDSASDAEWPDEIDESSPVRHDTTLPFNEIVKDNSILPNCEEGTIKAENQFVNTDGTVNTEAVKNVNGIDIDDVPVDPEEIQNAPAHQHISDYKEIVDRRREALAALGYNIKFRWQIATSSYAIINPDDAYLPAYRTLHEEGEADNIFGWVETRDWGGYANIYLLFADQTVEHPDDEDRNPIFMGVKTGYDFSSSRAFDVELFAYDSESQTRIFSLGEKRKRKHAGDPNDEENERENDRLPIKDWWEKEYENILTWTDDVAEDIQEATMTTINFSDMDFGLQEFYEYLDVADSYITGTDNDKEAIGAVQRARNHSPTGNVFTMWTLFYALATTLEKEFQGTKRDGAAYKVYADIAKNILRSPERMITRTRREHEAQRQEENDDESARTAIVSSDDDTAEDVEDITDIDGVKTEDELDLTEKQDIAEEKTQTLFGEDY